MSEPTKLHTIRVWDWPVRATHWSFALLVPALWLTAEYSWWGWHKRLGLVLLGLLVFRILWGFVGTRTARFSDFVKVPGALLAYLRDGTRATVGHSPLAALGTLALLGTMAAQVGMGLFAGDPFDGATGPLNHLVGVMTAGWLTDTHKWFYWVVLGLVALHLLAIAFYALVKRETLVRPMVTGKRETEGEGIGAVPLMPLAASLLIAVAFTAWIAAGAPGLG